MNFESFFPEPYLNSQETMGADTVHGNALQYSKNLHLGQSNKLNLDFDISQYFALV